MTPRHAIPLYFTGFVASRSFTPCQMAKVQRLDYLKKAAREAMDNGLLNNANSLLVRRS